MDTDIIHQLAMSTHQGVKRDGLLASGNDRCSTSSSAGGDDDLSSSSNSNSTGPLSIDDRLSRLESSIASLTAAHQSDLHELRSQLNHLLKLKSSPPPVSDSHNLNKNATPFVPSAPAANNTSNSTNTIVTNDLATGTINDQPFASLSQSDQIHSLSHQVNLLSNTMSQLLSTLLSSPSSPTPIDLSQPPSNQSIHLPKLRPTISQTLQPLQLPSPNPPLQRSHSINSFTSLGPINRAHNVHNNSRHPAHLNFNSSPANFIQNQLFDHAALPSPHLLISPVSSQHDFNQPRTLPTTNGPSIPPSPMSPASYDQSHHPVSVAPANSLAGKWEQLGITGDVLRAIVRFGIGPPTKAQQKSIPLMLVGKDLVSQSNPIQERIQAYVIAALQLISRSSNRNPPSAAYPTHFHLNKPTPPPSPNQSVKVLVITATLDEASQAYRLANGIASLLPSALKVSHCSSEPQTLSLHPAVSQHPQPHMLIGTPSKLLDPVNGLRGYTFDASDFICVVLDEMDQLLARNMTDMVTSLMNFLPSNQAPLVTRQSPPLPPPSQAAEWSNPAFNTNQRPSTVGRSVTSPVGPNFNPVPSPLHAGFPSGPQDTSIHGRQTCIFSCTVPQDVLTYARTLNLRARVLVRRDEPSNSASTHLAQQTPSNPGPYDMTDVRNQLPNSLPALSGRTSPQDFVKSFRQYYVSIMLSGGANGSRGREWKLDALVELLEDLECGPKVSAGETGQPFVLVYCNSVDSVESVSYKLVSRGIDALALHQDMGSAARHSILTRFNKGPLTAGPVGQKEPRMKALVVYDVLSKSLVDLQSYQSILPNARQTIVVNFELPRAVEDYVHRAACMIPNHKKSNQSAGVLINFVSVLSDVEMVKSIESFYRCKVNELPHHHLHLL